MNSHVPSETGLALSTGNTFETNSRTAMKHANLLKIPTTISQALNSLPKIFVKVAHLSEVGNTLRIFALRIGKLVLPGATRVHKALQEKCISYGYCLFFLVVFYCPEYYFYAAHFPSKH